MRNRWAHQDELTALDAWRTHDFAVRLLEGLGDAEGVERVDNLRDEAFVALAKEKGVAQHVAPSAPEPISAPKPVSAPSSSVRLPSDDPDVVRPDETVLQRTDSASTPTIGAGRAAFEPWTVVAVGEVTVLDDLPKKAAKEKIRAVAAEIAEFEGPIHIDRLARLTAASFGVRRLFSARQKKLTYQIRQVGLLIDDDKFVWPSDLEPATWNEFRPSDSTIDRPLVELSPVEIANAIRFLREQAPEMSEADLDAATLRTFGRRRKTRQLGAHLNRAKDWASQR